MSREELIPGRWYSGVERLIGGIGLWDGHAFAGYSFKFVAYVDNAYVDNAEWFFPENNYKLLELPE